MFLQKVKEYWRLWHRLFLVMVFLCILLLGYAALVEYHWIEETEYTVQSADWRGREVKLAVLADLHARQGDGAYLDDIVNRTLAMKPDAVLLLGDYMASHPGSRFATSMPAREIADHLKPLTALPCYAVLGNHDYVHGSAKMRAALQGIGMHMMEGRRERLDIDGAPLDIGGIRCLFTFRTPGRIPQPQKGVPFILLSHSPYGTSFAPQGTLITLSGHTHGGQVCLPFIGAVFSIDSHVPCSRSSGAHVLSGHQLEYVSRGLGSSVLPIRFCCRPELLLLRIRGGKS
ncbi:MAG: metallophosphoesterase [Akkermansia sp.]|nr:metallophosphoesterase [Akkermansia sp.]